MANKDHLAELKKGTAHWNAWVLTQGEDFRAYLTEADLIDAELAGADLVGVDLAGARLIDANLGGTKLTGANLRKAILEGAEFVGADLRGADLGGAILKGADLRGAYLGGADLKEANVVEANARTTLYAAVGTNDGRAAEYTDLSTARFLTQSQLDSMKGDSGTIIPENLTRPDHWETLEGHLNGQRVELDAQSRHPLDLPNPTGVYQDSETSSIGLNRQVSFLLKTAPAAAQTARFAAGQIESAIQEFHSKTQQNGSEEGDAFFAVARSFKALSLTIEEAEAKAARIPVLEEEIRGLRERVEHLTLMLNNMQSTRKQIMIGALSNVLGYSITTSLGFLLGTWGPELINSLHDALESPANMPTTPTPPIDP